MPEQAARWARDIPPPDCADKNPMCGQWAQQGACENNSREWQGQGVALLVLHLLINWVTMDLTSVCTLDTEHVDERVR